MVERRLGDSAATGLFAHIWAWVKESWSVRPIYRLWIILGAVAVAAFCYLSLASLVRVNLGSDNDLSIFYRAANDFYAGRRVYEPGQWGYLYPPAFVVLLGLIAWLPPSAFYVAFGLVNLGLTLLCLSLVYRLLRNADPALVGSRLFVVIGLPLLCTAHYWFCNLFIYGQANILLMALVLGGLVMAEKQRDWSAGILLGMAVAVKLAPALFVLYFLLHKRARIAVGAVIVFLVFNGLLPVLIRGWDGTLALYNEYYVNFLQPTMFGSQGVHYLVYHDKNVSLSGALARYLVAPEGAGAPGVNLLNVPPAVFSWIDKALRLALLVPLMVAFRREPREPRRRLNEYIVILLAVFLLNAVTWPTYLIFLILPLALVTADNVRRERWSFAGIVLLAWPLVEAAAFFANRLGVYKPAYLLFVVSSITVYLIGMSVYFLRRRFTDARGAAETASSAPSGTGR
ncbi:MAG TPA: glycosyltransferase family 87 protein [bacterium]|nr:glycosyltransferase family 87 protein [bacterium]